MNFSKFKEMVDSYVKAKLDYQDYLYQGTYRQDDEYTLKAIATHNAVKELYEQIERVIASTNDKRFKEYFSKENIVSLMHQYQEEKGLKKI